jgi:hypothetical protein
MLGSMLFRSIQPSQPSLAQFLSSHHAIQLPFAQETVVAKQLAPLQPLLLFTSCSPRAHYRIPWSIGIDLVTPGSLRPKHPLAISEGRAPKDIRAKPHSTSKSRRPSTIDATTPFYCATPSTIRPPTLLIHLQS